MISQALLIFVFINSIAAAVLCSAANKNSARKLIYLYLIFILVFVATFRDGSIMPDYSTYVGLYQRAIDGSLDVYIDWSYVLISISFFWIGERGYMAVFFVYALISVLVKLYAISRLTTLYFFSLVLYISNYFILHEMIQIRTGVASAFILLSFHFLIKKSLLKFFSSILFATFFHATSFIFLFSYFLKPTRLNKFSYAMLIPFAYILYLTSTDPITISLNAIFGGSYVGLKEAYFDNDLNALVEINVFSLFIIIKILFLIGFITFAYGMFKRNPSALLMIKIYALGVFSYISLAGYPIIAVRLGYVLMLTEIILIPQLLFLILQKNIAMFLVFLYSGAYLTANIYFTQYFNYNPG